jgi:ABC-type lipoprotein export system ATPase subunit
VLIGLFRELNEQQQLTVILVTHDQDVARNARRTVVLRDGRIVADTADFAQALQALHSSVEEEPVVQAESAD